MDVRNQYRVIMHATAAYHLLGDISRPGDAPAGMNLATIYLDDGLPKVIVDPEYGPCFEGAWLSGLGFINVRFPVSTTRDLSPIEAEWLTTKAVTV